MNTWIKRITILAWAIVTLFALIKMAKIFIILASVGTVYLLIFGHDGHDNHVKKEKN